MTPLLCENVKMIYALGGYSGEKVSIVSEYLKTKYNVTKLKISYILDIISSNGRASQISLESDDIFAELVVNELERFSKHQDYPQEISLEYLDNSELVRCLKNILGNKLLVIYVDCKFRDKYLESEYLMGNSNNSSGTASCKSDVRLRSSSDFVVYCDSDPFDLYAQLDTVFLKKSLENFTPNILPIEELKIPSQFKEILNFALETFLAQFGDRARLFAVVGSSGYQGIRDNWSDIDIFIVIDHKSLLLVRTWFRYLQESSPIRIGLAIVTPAELSILRIEFKVANSLYMLATGKLAAQFIKEGYKLPSIPDSHRRTKNLNNVPDLVHNLRKALIDENPNTRLILKLILRVMRNLLQFERNEAANIDEIMLDFHILYPEVKQLGFLNYDDIINQNIGNEQVVIMALKFVEWYENHLFIVCEP